MPSTYIDLLKCNTAHAATQSTCAQVHLLERLMADMLTSICCDVQHVIVVGGAAADGVLLECGAQAVLVVRGSACPTMKLLQVVALERVVSLHMHRNEVDSDHALPRSADSESGAEGTAGSSTADS